MGGSSTNLKNHHLAHKAQWKDKSTTSSVGPPQGARCKVYARAIIEKCPRQERGAEITFKEKEREYLDPNHDNTLVVFVKMINARVKRVMIDTSSFANILYFDAFQKFRLSANNLSSMASSLTGFMGDSDCEPTFHFWRRALLQDDDDQIHRGEHSLGLQCNHRSIYSQLTKGDGIQIPHGNEIPDKS